MFSRRRSWSWPAAWAAGLVLALGGSAVSCQDRRAPQEAPRADAGDDDGLARVAAIHGGSGPFAVAGYRMGQRALRELGVPRGMFDLEVIHRTPPVVQWSCIADGLQASTGASAGKLSLKVIEVSAARATSVVRDRRTGRALELSLTAAFVSRFADLPRPQLAGAGREVMALRDDEIFTVTPIPVPGSASSADR